MPRRRRPPQGYQYSSGGGGIDLGSLLMGGLGGTDVTTNPGTPDNLQGPATAQEYRDTGNVSIGGNAPSVQVKPRSWFDRNRASQIQSEYNLGQAEEDAASRRKIAEQGQLNTLDVDKQRQLAAIAVLQAAGILPTTHNTGQYDISIVPQVMDALAQQKLAEAEAAKTAAIRSKQEGDLSLAGSQDIFQAGLSRLRQANKEAQFNLEHQPQTSQASLQTAISKPVYAETESQAQRFKPITNAMGGVSLFDVNTGKLAYEGPTKWQQIQGMLPGQNNVSLGAPQTYKPTPQPIPQQPQGLGELTTDDLIIDPTTKKILGVKRR